MLGLSLDGEIGLKSRYLSAKYFNSYLLGKVVGL